LQYLELTEVAERLRAIGPVRSKVQEYRATMGYLHLELWADDHSSRTFSKRGDLYFSDCFFISGPTQGGPWELSATQVEEAGQEVIKVSAGDDRFYVKALRIALSVPD